MSHDFRYLSSISIVVFGRASNKPIVAFAKCTLPLIKFESSHTRVFISFSISHTTPNAVLSFSNGMS